MRYVVTVIVCFVLVAGLPSRSIYGGPVPPIPASRLQPAIPGGRTLPVKPPVNSGTPVPSYTRAELERSPISGILYRGILEGLTTGTANAENAASLTQSFQPALDAFIQGSANASADANRDAEPSVIAITAGGSDRTTSAVIKYAPGPFIYYSSTTDFANFLRGRMPTTGYTYSGDPYLDLNPSAGGVAPYRTYCAGISFNSTTSPQNSPNAIVVWHSDPADNGAWTSAPAIVDSRGAGYLLDKPSMTVSWHNGVDLGYVYTAYTSFDYVNNNSAIVVARSTDGGVTFPQKTILAYGGGATSGLAVVFSQVVVAPNSGVVYVLWVNEGASDIRMASSSDFGVTFGAHEIAATVNLVQRPALNGGIRAPSMPMARYNSVANSINVVWHDGSSGNTEIQYAYRDSFGWHRPPTPIVQFAMNDQFMPALDFNSQGNVVVTYYDRHADPSNLAYRGYEAFINASGTRLDANDQWMGGFDSTVPANGFIGDYQGVWDWTYATGGERAIGSWIGITGTINDNWLTQIGY